VVFAGPNTYSKSNYWEDQGKRINKNKIEISTNHGFEEFGISRKLCSPFFEAKSFWVNLSNKKKTNPRIGRLDT